MAKKYSVKQRIGGEDYYYNASEINGYKLEIESSAHTGSDANTIYIVI